MYKLKIIAVLVINLTVFASRLTGLWAGQGEYRTTKGTGNCDQIFFELRDEQERFVIVNGAYGCDFFTGEYSYSVFKKIEGKLYYGSVLSGSYNDSKVHIYSEENGFNLYFEKTLAGLNYLETWDDGQDIFSVKSEMEIVEQ